MKQFCNINFFHLFQGVEIDDAFVGKLPSSVGSKKALCDIDSYDYNAPTKQNVLCNRRSVRDILIDHPDFSSVEQLAQSNILQILEQSLEENKFATKIRNKDSFDIEMIRDADDEEIENETLRPEFNQIDQTN